MADETTAYLSLGSNMGDRMHQLQAALEAIGKLSSTRIVRQSPMYETKAWGKTDQADFLNMVVEIATALDPHELLRLCKEIEARQGRVDGERWGPRPIDIDVLLYGGQNISTDTLTVPHPRMWERAFVLRPLADIAPDLHHPNGTPITEWLRREDIASQEAWPYIRGQGLDQEIA